MGTLSDIRDQRYRTEPDIGTSNIGTSDIRLKRSDFNIISDVRINFYPILNIRHPIVHRSAQWLSGNALAHDTKGHEFDPSRYKINCSESDVDVGCWISPTLRSMLAERHMPGVVYLQIRR